jgi:hypothetical protein
MVMVREYGRGVSGERELRARQGEGEGEVAVSEHSDTRKRAGFIGTFFKFP